ncbi:MAG: secretin and TonB N-terminal domain-containing protein [Planctomycetota bacterium]
MRSKFSNRHLMSVLVCSAAMALGTTAFGQDAPPPVEPLESDPVGEQEISQNETGGIDLSVNDTDITKILQLLSFERQVNIRASKDVAGKISLDLYNVTFEQALDSVLLPNGYRWVQEGNFVTVMTADEFEKMEQANRPILTKIVRLNYLRASDAANFLTPLLTQDTGTITASGDVEEGFQADVSSGGSNQYAGAPTLIIRDYEDKIDEILSVIEQLDVQPKQVIIEATILTASLSEANAFGVDFALFSNLNSANPLGALGDLVSGTTGEGLVSSVGNTAPATQEGIKLGFVAGDAAVFVRALDSVTDTTLIATPKTTVLDRNRADILVGQKIAYLSSTVTETATTETVEFLEVGTQLSVRPFVSDDGKVRLELRPSVSDATIRDLGGTTAPDEETVELITNVIVESGQTIVLGGLFTEDTTVDRDQVPGLGNIRGIGRAFQGQDDTVDRSEVIFLVKATVVDNQTLIDLGAEGSARVDASAVAERRNLLPWSRSNVTSSHLINARRHFDEAQNLSGAEREDKLSKALYCVDMALHLNPSMVDALLLKQEITGEQMPLYLESHVNQTFDAVLQAEIEELGLPELPEPEEVGQDELPDPTELAQAGPQLDDPSLAEVVAQALAQSDAEQAEAQARVEAEAEPAAPQGLTSVEVHDRQLDEVWLQQMLEADEAQTAEPVEPQVVAAPGKQAEPSEFEDIEPIDVRPQDPEFAENPTPEEFKVFGFSWRSLTTAQLLQLAAQAGEAEQPEDEPIDATQAEVQTDTD